MFESYQLLLQELQEHNSPQIKIREKVKSWRNFTFCIKKMQHIFRTISKWLDIWPLIAVGQELYKFSVSHEVWVIWWIMNYLL